MKRALGARLITATPRNSSDEASYALGERIGKGAFAQVFKAIDVNSAQIVAIKEIPLSEISSVESIMREIELLQDLAHPNIVQYLGFVKTDDIFHIVLEYCENGSLAAILRRFGVFPENLLSIYMFQVLEGLAYLHEQGTIHRDIKGANILTTKDGVAKLADFGVATDALSAEGPQVVGTPHWMAPEIIQLQEPTIACDIWSLGCTVIELSTGKPPYHELSGITAMYSMVNDDLPPIPVDSAPLVRDFLELCFQKDPNLRTSAAQLLDHAWIRRAKPPPPVPDVVKTIQNWNSPRRRQKLSVASQLDLRDAYREADQQVGSIGSALSSCVPLKAPASHRTVSVSKFIEKDDDFDDIADQLESAAPVISSPQKSPRKSPQKLLQKPLHDPFEGIAELMVEEPNQRLITIHEEVNKIITLLYKAPSTQVPVDIYYTRLCELINAEPSIKKIILQNRILRIAIKTATSRPDNKRLEAILDFIHVMVTKDENALETFCLNNGLSLLLSLFSSLPHRCLLILIEVLENYPFGPRLVVCQSQYLAYLSSFISSKDSQTTPLAARCILTIFEKFGARKRAELWYLFNSASLLQHVIGALDAGLALPSLYALVTGFSRLPPEVIAEFVNKHALRKLMHVYRHLPSASEYRLEILRVYKSLSTVPEALQAIEQGKLEPYFVRILADCYKKPVQDTRSHLRAACLLPLFHNYCRLSAVRQQSLAKDGLVPLLLATSSKEPDLKEFSLPLICAMAHNGNACWKALWESDGLQFLIDLINEPGWEMQAMAAITAWLTRQVDNPELDLSFIRHGGITAIVQVVNETRAEIFAAIATSLSTLVDQCPQVCSKLPAQAIFGALCEQLSESVVSTALVRILMVIRRVLETQDCVPELLSTGLHEKVLQLSEGNVPVMCKRLAANIIKTASSGTSDQKRQRGGHSASGSRKSSRGSQRHLTKVKR